MRAAGLLALAGLLAPPLSAELPEDLIPPDLDEPINLLVPQELWHLSHAWDEGIARIRLGPDGRVIDWIPLSLPHHKLFRPVERALEWARFQPAYLNGEPVTLDLNVSIPLRDLGGYGVITETSAEHIESRMAGFYGHWNSLVVSSPEELDKPLALMDPGDGVVAVDENGDVIKGTVMVEFYLDPNGLPRMIQATGDVDPVLAEAAVMNVEAFRFQPPKRNGRPTVVRARIPVVMSER